MWSGEKLLNYHDQLCGSVGVRTDRAYIEGDANLGVQPVLGRLVRMREAMYRLKEFVEDGHLENIIWVETALQDILKEAYYIAFLVKEPKVSITREAEDLCKKAKDIMTSKNHDYSGAEEKGQPSDRFANFRGSVALGIHPVLGILLRMQDKTMRIKTFAEKGQLLVKGESVEDALVDIVNYCILAGGFVIEAKEEKEQAT